MTDIYVRIGAVGGDGTEPLPYGLISEAYTDATGGGVDTIYISASEANPWVQDDSGGNGEVRDQKGVSFVPWEFPQIWVDATANPDFYSTRCDNPNSYFEGFVYSNVQAGKWGHRVEDVCLGLKDLIFQDSGTVADGGGGSGIIFGGNEGGGTQDNITNLKFRRIYGAGTAFRLEAEVNASYVMNIDGLQINDCTNGMLAKAGTINVNNFITECNTNQGLVLQSTAIVNITGDTSANIGGRKYATLDTVGGPDTAAANYAEGMFTWPTLVQDKVSTTPPQDMGLPPVFQPEVRGPDGDIGQFYQTSRREARVAIVRDDLNLYFEGRPTNTGPTDANDGGSLIPFLNVCEKYGFKSTHPLATNKELDTVYMDGYWPQVDMVIARGHEVVTHGSSGYQLNLTDWVNMTYTGAGSALVSISGGVLTSTGGDTNLNIDLNQNDPSNPTRLLQCFRLAQLIEADPNWSAFVDDGPTNNNGSISAPAFALADITNVSFTSGVGQWLASDNARAFDYEFVNNADEIQNNTASGYVTPCHVYSQGSYLEDFTARMISDGRWNGGRVGATPQSGFGTDSVYKFPGQFDPTLIGVGPSQYGQYQPFLGQGILIGSLVDRSTEVSFRRGIEAYCQWAMWHGAQLVFYGHQFGVTGGATVIGSDSGNPELSLEEWDWMLDTIDKSGITKATLSELYAWSETFTDNSIPNPASDDSWQPVLYVPPVGEQPSLGEVMKGISSSGNGMWTFRDLTKSSTTLFADEYWSNAYASSMFSEGDQFLIVASDKSQVFNIDAVSSKTDTVTLSTGLEID